MNKREKVIAGLECCRYDPDPGYPDKGAVVCPECPYYNDGWASRCAELYTDAINLIRQDHVHTGFTAEESEIIATMQEEVDEWKDYTDSELSGGVTVDCDFYLKILNALKKRPSKGEIKHAISNIDRPAGIDEEQFFAVMANIYYALAKLYGEEIPMIVPSEEAGNDNTD